MDVGDAPGLAMIGLHTTPISATGAVLASWEWRPDVLIAVVGLGSVYVAGWVRLRRLHPRAARPGPLGLYLAGLLAIAVALLSPIDMLADRLLTVHMVQHELLTMVAAPLLLLADPLRAVVWALPQRGRRLVGPRLTRDARPRRILALLTFMPVAWLLYMVVLWGWHLPVAYEAALGSAGLHDLQHVSFFGAALLFWWPIANPAPRLRGHIPYEFRLAYVGAAAVLTTPPMMAIAFFMPRVLYPHYAAAARLWGLSALDDQSMAWGLMGVLDGAVYAIAFLLLVARMASREEHRMRLGEAIGLASVQSRR